MSDTPTPTPTDNPPAPTPPPALPQDWRATLPPELATEKSLTKFTDLAALARGYIELERARSTALPTPNDQWTDKDWDDFYTRIGRPEKPEAYQFPGDLPEGIEPDSDLEAWFRATAHQSGLTPRQANQLRQAFIKIQAERAATAAQTAAQAAAQREADITQLKTELGPEFDAAISAARAVVREFGGDDFAAYLRDTGLGNDTHLTRFLIKVGRALADDKVLLTGSAASPLASPHTALAEIARLKADRDFARSLMDAGHPGHTEAKRRWDALHKAAYPQT